MNKLNAGEFFGSHLQKSTCKNIVITDTEYTHKKVDWHYHENPYFTYLLQGKLFEANKKREYYLEPGSLLFHNWQDAHRNVKPNEFTRGFHVELSHQWFMDFDIQLKDFEGSLDLRNPTTKAVMNSIFIESKINDSCSILSIDSLLIELFESMITRKKNYSKPTWVDSLRELLLEEQTDYSLKNLSKILGIHPVHLSREFSRYFGTNLGNYVRLLKLNKAFFMLLSSSYSMTEIGYLCGFYDQSHFISNFKRIYHTTPTDLRHKIQ